MQVAARSRRLTLGVSLATASVIAISPMAVSAPIAHVPTPPALSSAAVRLAADYNPLQPWVDAFQTAQASAGQIGSTFLQAPAVLLQQFLVNQAAHLGEVLSTPGSIGTVLGQVGHNVQAAIIASTLIGFDQRTQYLLSQASLDGWHDILRQSIPKILPEGTPPQAKALIEQVLNVLSSPLSGVAMGLIGPLISPVVAFVNSLHDVVTAAVAGDFTTAVQNVINIPANIVGAALNGANLNLDGLVPLLNGAKLLTGTSLNSLNVQFGGLFSAGVTGVYEDGIGGSIFNAIGMNTDTDMMGFPLNLDITGRAIGPIAAFVTLGQIIAKAIGWDGTGNPLAPLLQQPALAGTDTAAESATALVSKATSTNESPAAIPSAATSTVSLTVSPKTVQGANTTVSESISGATTGATTGAPSAAATDTTDENASGAKSDEASAGASTEPKTEGAGGVKSGSAGEAGGVKSGSAGDDGVKSGSAGGAGGVKSGSAGEAGGVKSGSVKKPSAGEGGADSGATSHAASGSQE
jgi:hypothetical protein